MQSTQGQQHASTCRVARHRMRGVPTVSIGCRGVCAMWGALLKGRGGSLGDVLTTCKCHNNVSCRLQSGSVGYPTREGKPPLTDNQALCGYDEDISFTSYACSACAAASPKPILPRARISGFPSSVEDRDQDRLVVQDISIHETFKHAAVWTASQSCCFLPVRSGTHTPGWAQ